MSERLDASRVAPNLGPLEADVLRELWRQGQATVRSVLEALNASAERERAHSTVMTVMQRLGDKGLAVRRRSGRTDVYTAALSREEFRETRVAAEAAALVQRYGDAALVAFVRALERTDTPQRVR
jgi:BlaI family transcriptional regulator, penicillinase repressor